MLLVLDVGNTNTTLGVFAEAQLKQSWRLTTERQRTVDEYGIMCRTLLQLSGIEYVSINHIAIASVVPQLDFTLDRMARTYFKLSPLFISAANAGMKVLYEDPTEVGADRIINAVGAYEQLGGPCIVVDFGTATTFDVVSKSGDYMGGIICPGIQISADALFQRAARLRSIDIRRPPKLIGTNAAGSVQSGLYYGTVSMVDGVLERIMAEIGPAQIVATGGLAPLIGSDSRLIRHINADLTLEGMRIIFDRNSESGSPG